MRPLAILWLFAIAACGATTPVRKALPEYEEPAATPTPAPAAPTPTPRNPTPTATPANPATTPTPTATANPTATSPH